MFHISFIKYYIGLIVCSDWSLEKVFYHGLKNLDKIRIKNYSQLNRIIKENLFLLKKVNLKKKEYCLKSDNVSNRVFKFYKNYKWLNQL